MYCKYQSRLLRFSGSGKKVACGKRDDISEMRKVMETRKSFVAGRGEKTPCEDYRCTDAGCIQMQAISPIICEGDVRR